MPQRKKILLIDDNKINRTMLSNALKEHYFILEAEDGAQGYDILKSTLDIAVILLDLAMPKMNGYEFLKKVREDKILNPIPIVVLTQENTKEVEFEVLSLGAYDFLSKPYNIPILEQRIANILQFKEMTVQAISSQRDLLTGAFSKEFFYKQIEECLRKNPYGKYDLVCGDIEKFKLVNDLYGKEEGDQLLCLIAQRTKEKLKANGYPEIFGRVGPDIFAVLLPRPSVYPKQNFVEEMTQLNAQTGIGLNISMKYGIYQIDERDIPISLMCDRACLAASSIKGKYEIILAYYDHSLRDQMVKEQLIVNSMQKALEENEFQIYYQPKYDIKTKQVIGAEALVRWYHPIEGIISPADFIPVFEKNGFITRLDMYVWEEACKKLSQWKKEGRHHIPLSVNVSRVDIYYPQFTKYLNELMQKYDLSPSMLHLEITETAYTENPAQLIEVVAQLKNQGFIIEMDDFGEGYSSLNMLSELPIDIIKMDMRFLKKKGSLSGNNIINFIVSLAKWMGLKVVAEGVEVAAQADMLNDLDCDYAQGYYYAKPLSTTEFEKLMDTAKAKRQASSHLTATQEEIAPSFHNAQQNGVMLVVDDMYANRQILSNIFKPYYHIVQVENGAQALDYLRVNQKEVQVILLDLIMPVMDGFQTLEYLKRSEDFKDIPVVVTSQSNDGAALRALELGAAEFLSKPYYPALAVKRVENVLAGRHRGKYIP